MNESSQIITAPAKINLFLRIVGRRPDGYHELVSVMQKLRLADKLTLRLTPEGISLTCDDPSLPVDEGNLAVRAARLFFQHTGRRGGVRMHLEKMIPMASGLGGGSSDAAAVLLSLNQLHGRELSEDDLADLGLALGADIPFFIRPASAALARGVGERLTPAVGLTCGSIVLVNPGFPVSTKWVYENFALTSEGNPYILAPESAALTSGNSGADSLVFDVAAAAIFSNDLEMVTIGRYPEIGRIKEALLGFGARVALMSGSGPTVFGLFAKGHESEAQAACRFFRSTFPESVFLTEPRPA